jgi:hypothetical protein
VRFKLKCNERYEVFTIRRKIVKKIFSKGCTRFGLVIMFFFYYICFKKNNIFRSNKFKNKKSTHERISKENNLRCFNLL